LTFLVAFTAGAAAAAVGLFFESFSVGPGSFSTPALAVYMLLGGVCALGMHAVLCVIPDLGYRVNTIVLLLAVLWANSLYLLNAVALAGEHYASLKSLACDVAVTVPYALIILVAARSRWLADLHSRHTQTLAAAGIMIILWSTFSLASFAKARAPEPRQRNPDLPNIALVVLDSVRRDHLGYHGYDKPTSVALDRWAAGARVYKKAFSTSTWTLPSVLSLFRVPQQLRANADLAQLLERRGYVTGCFSDNAYFTRGSPLSAGFDVTRRSVGRWRDPIRLTMLGEVIERFNMGNDRSLVDEALTWTEKAGTPWFLYIHLMDSHFPYRFAPIDAKRRSGRWIDFPLSGMEMSLEEHESVVARYDGGVRSATDQAARLLAGLSIRQQPFLGIVTADHGESLGEDDRWMHASGLFPELLAVPLFAFGHGVTPGLVVDPVGHASITKTVLSAAGIACSNCEGSDLRFSEGDEYIRGVFPPDLGYAVGRGYKLVVDTRANSKRLYSLNDDPTERTDLATARPDVVQLLFARYEAGPRLPMDADAIERFRAIGYIGIVK
jgi:arylsulfatase A-like enzyme